MIIIVLALLILVTSIVRPLSLVYFLLGFVFFNGLAPRSLIAQIKFSVGPVNVFPLDFAFGTMVLLLLLAPLLRTMGIASRQRWSKEARVTSTLVVL